MLRPVFLSRVLRLLALAAVSLVATHTAIASDHLHFSGFGSVALSHDDSRGIALLRDTGQPVSENRDTSWRSDSVLGLKGGWRLSPTLELAGQVVLRHRVDAKPRSIIEGAHLTWHPSERVDVRVGRMGLDVFMLSDYRSVGYAQPWVRPPREFYGWIPMHTLDGADVAWKFDHGATRWTARLQLGANRTEVPLTADDHFSFRAKRMRALTLHAERDAWQFKLGHSVFRAGSEPPPFVPLRNALAGVAGGGFGPVSAEAASLRAGLALKDIDIHYSTLGAAYDDGRWLIQGELARVRSDSEVIATGTAAYVSVGRRFGPLTPYVVLVRFRPSNGAREPLNDWSGLGASELQTQAVASYNNFRVDQRTLSLGMRWDFDSRAALTMQWDRSRIAARGFGLWQVDNLVSGERRRTVDVLTLSLDFVF